MHEHVMPTKLNLEERPNILMVSQDYGSSAVWLRNQGGGMANCSSYNGFDFNFPDWLICKLDFWSAWHERENDPNEEEGTIDWTLFHAYGLSLAIDVKRIVGDKYVVYYDTDQEVPFIPFDPQCIPSRDDLDKAKYQ